MNSSSNNSRNASDNSRNASDYRRWMSNLNPLLKLTQVAIPGAHDAGTYGINCASQWNPHRTDEASTWTKIAKWFAPCIVVNYSKVQNLNLIEQFNQGVRYWDLRVAKYQPDTSKPPQYLFTHGLLGTDFIKNVVELIHYSKQYPKEILILDIRFIYGFNDDDNAMLKNVLTEAIGDNLIDSINYKPTDTLQKLWNDGKSIVVMWKLYDQHYGKLWPSHYLTMVWPNKTNADEAITFFNEYMKEENDGEELFGLHATLTPDGHYIATHLWSSTQHLASLLNNKLVPLIKGGWKGKLNCIMYDVVEYPQLTEAVIESNF